MHWLRVIKFNNVKAMEIIWIIVKYPFQLLYFVFAAFAMHVFETEKECKEIILFFLESKMKKIIMAALFSETAAEEKNI